MHKKSIVYLSHSPPTLGLMARWQFDEYTYTRCWPIEIVIKCFSDIGMTEFVREDEDSYRYDKNWFKTDKNPIIRLFQRGHRIIGKHYLNSILKKNKPFNKNLFQKNVRQLFKFTI